MDKILSPTEAQAQEIISIIPRGLLGRHRSFAMNQEEAMWGSGEFSLELQDNYYPDYSKAAIRRVVAEIYSISVGTVRDRERVAAAVPQELRDLTPYLKFHHWRNIIPAGQAKAEQMLIEAAEMHEHEGKGPTVDQIISWREIESLDATPPWIYRLQTGLEKLELIRDDPLADPVIRGWFDELIKKVEARAKELKLERFSLGEGKTDESTTCDLEVF